MPVARFVDVIVVRAIERHRTRVRFPRFRRASRRRADVRRPRLWCLGGFSCLAVHDAFSPEKQKGHHPYRMMALGSTRLLCWLHHPMAVGIRIMPTLVRSRPSSSQLDTPTDASVDALKARGLELAVMSLLEDQNQAYKSSFQGLGP